MATNFDQIIDGRPIATTANSGFALWGLTCFVETFVQGSTFVLRMNISAKNPPQRKAAKRCIQYIFRTYAESFSPIFSE